MNNISEAVRRDFASKDDERDRGLQIPDDLERFCDIQYADDPYWQVLDVYRPKDRAGEILPVIVSVHGGSWVYGDKNRYQFYCMSLAQQGFAVVNFTYRLAPEFKCPAPFEDTNAVMYWVMRHADEYGFDLGNLFAVGDSAGAHILSLYTSIMVNSDYAYRYSFYPPEGIRFRAIALNCGFYHLKLTPENREQLRPLIDAFLPHGGSEEEQWLMSPDLHVADEFPPVYLMTSSGDFLKQQTPLMLSALMEYNIEVEFHFYQRGENTLGHVFMLNMHLPEAHECNAETCDFFRRHMR